MTLLDQPTLSIFINIIIIIIIIMSIPEGVVVDVDTTNGAFHLAVNLLHITGQCHVFHHAAHLTCNR